MRERRLRRPRRAPNSPRQPTRTALHGTLLDCEGLASALVEMLHEGSDAGSVELAAELEQQLRLATAMMPPPAGTGTVDVIAAEWIVAFDGVLSTLAGHVLEGTPPNPRELSALIRLRDAAWNRL